MMKVMTWSTVISIFLNLVGINEDFEMEMAKTYRVRLDETTSEQHR